MSNQLVITSGAKVRSLNGVITGTTGVLNSLPINAANGIPQLDVNGKILVSQLPNSVMEYQGTWNANTNTPTLVNGIGNQGDVWLCNVAGTTNFGAGPIAFVVGDQVIYSGSIWQRASGSTGTVTSVAVTETGDALTITGSPITTSGTINVGFAGTSLQYVAGNGALVTFPTLISSIGLSMPSAFSVANSPLTANGTLAVTGAGFASQYIRGDGTLADFPSSGGGGSSVSYYLNGGTSQGVIGGVTYYEMSKTADTGTGVDFPKTGDGLIVSFLTDANDPAQLNIPGGNWNYEIYVSMSANGGTPQLYAELYKYDGTTFTLISTSSNEIIYDGVNLNLYTFAMAVPTTTLTVTDRLAVKLYATNSGGKTTTVHTQNSHLCQVITTFSTGITALNGLTAQVQYFQVGTSGTDFNISSTTATHTFNLPTASAANRGALSSADWTTFNNKASTADLANYLPLTGGTLSGLLNISTASYLTSRLKLTNTATGGNIWGVSSGNANNSINNSLFTIINETLSKNTFVLSPTGKLAIGENLGTINPADALSVYDTNTILRVFDLTGNGSSVVLQATNTASYVNAAYNTTAIPLILRTANTTRLTIAATGEATFTGAIIGTTSTFTNAGSGIGVGITNSSTGDGLKITHSAGRALQIVSSATGFGILINNDTASTSVPFTIQKSGSPVITMTDAGGLTLAGALTGTSATFSDTVAITLTASDSRIKGGDATGRLLLANSGTTTYGIFYGASHATYPNTISLVTDNTERLKITNTGAATFSSSVTATTITLNGTGNFLNATPSTGTNPCYGSLTNTGGSVIWGLENNGGGAILTGTAAYSASFGTQNATSLNLGTNGVSRLTISSTGAATFSGQVAINGASLDINPSSGNSNITLRTANVFEGYIQAITGGGILFGTGASATERMRISSAGVVTITGLGTGTVYSTAGVLSVVSDMTLKNDDGFIDNALEKVMNLKPRYFHWKEESTLPTDLRQLGFYAQEVNAALGEEAANTPKENQYFGINDRAIIAFLTKAIQELKAEIDELKNK